MSSYDIDYQTLDEEDMPGAGQPTPDYPTPPVIKKFETGYYEHEAQMEMRAERFREVARSKEAKARELKLSGKDLQAGVAFSAYATARVVTGYYQTLTLPIRPEALRQTPLALLKLPETLSRDPGAIFEIGGGLLAGPVFSQVTKSIKPKTPKFIDTKTVTSAPESVGIGKSPATLMPRGKWRATWEITSKRRGSTVLLTETLAKRGRQLTGFDPLRGIAYLPALGVRSTPTLLNVPQMDLFDRPDPLLKYQDLTKTKLHPLSIQEPSVKTLPSPQIETQKERQKRRWIGPLGRIDFWFKSAPFYVQAPISVVNVALKPFTVPRLKPIQVQTQTQKQIQTQAIFAVPRLTQKVRVKSYVPRSRKKKKKRGDKWDLRGIFELRVDPLKIKHRKLSLKKVLSV